VAACADPEIPRFTLLVPSPYTHEDGVQFLTHAEAQWRRGAAAERTFAITAAGEFLGVVGIGLDTGVLGYWLKREARGRGWTTRAVVAVVAWAREQGLERFTLTTHPDNIASQRVALKAGFREVGVVDEPRGFRDGTTKAILFELAGQAP
jgi:RimJ/RimL family protein N-acetyltransferase